MGGPPNRERRRPLHPLESLTQTIGCRHSDPEICRNNSTPKKCAFVRTDKACFMPPKSWPRLFAELSELKGNSE
jgi:hypothetical protein